MSELPQSPLVLYQTADGQTRIQCRFENENVWLTQALMAELFQTTPQNITLHLRAIYAEGELQEEATCKEYLQVRSEGGRQIQRSLRHYSLEAILPDSGKVSREATHQRAEEEYERFATRRRAELEAQGEADLLNLLDAEVKKLPKRKTGGKQ